MRCLDALHTYSTAVPFGMDGRERAFCTVLFNVWGIFSVVTVVGFHVAERDTLCSHLLVRITQIVSRHDRLTPLRIPGPTGPWLYLP
jgi:hypothetical protein